MIRNEKEYQEAVRRSVDEKQRLKAHKQHLLDDGLTKTEVRRALEPLRSFQLQLEEEIASYERLKRGDFDELFNLHGIGRVLVGLRISLGFSQRELAKKLQVDESQVSRDERNEYYGIKTERVTAILDALGVSMRSTIDLPERKLQPIGRVETAG